MKVKELRQALDLMDPEANVAHLWDGEPRTNIEHVYMSKTGKCVTADFGQVAYSEEGRPKDAPTSEDQPYWRTPDDPLQEI